LNIQAFYNDLLLISFLLAAIVFVTLFFFAAPYGRHIRKGWGPEVRNKLAWIVMESPSPVFFAVCFSGGQKSFIGTADISGVVGSTLYPPRFHLPFQPAREPDDARVCDCDGDRFQSDERVSKWTLCFHAFHPIYQPLADGPAFYRGDRFVCHRVFNQPFLRQDFTQSPRAG